MSTMSIIDQLKKNKRPLILMNSELQAAMLSMTPEDFLCLQDTSFLNDPHWTPVNSGGDWCVDSNLCNTFRLRSDYEEKPSIVIQEWPIFTYKGELRFKQVLADMGDIGWCIDMVSRRPDFIGFKFEDGKIRQSATAWLDDNLTTYPTMDEILTNCVGLAKATHVLFRESK